jgi:hypothetical protein
VVGTVRRVGVSAAAEQKAWAAKAWTVKKAAIAIQVVLVSVLKIAQIASTPKVVAAAADAVVWVWAVPELH